MWKEIKGYEGLYEVSDTGEIRSMPRKGTKGGLLKAHEDAKGYLVLGLTKDGKQTQKRVHRLVAEAFLPNPEEFPEVNHKDEDKFNNTVDNLEWCTSEYNLSYGTRLERATTAKQRAVRCIETGEEFASIREAAAIKGIDSSTLSKVCQGKKHTIAGLHWCYAEEETPTHVQTRNCRPVRCVETQVVYPSAKAAGQTLNCDPSSITKVCRGKAKTCGGYHWKYVEE